MSGNAWSGTRGLVLLLGAAGVAVLLYWLRPVLTPFLVAALLAYLGNPLVGLIEGEGRPWRIARTPAVVAVFALLFSLLVLSVLLVIPVLQRELARFMEWLPQLFEWFRTQALPWVQERIGLSDGLQDTGPFSAALAEHWQQARDWAVSVLGSLGRSGSAVLAWLLNLVLVPVVTFYLLRDWDRLLSGIRALVPRRVEPRVVRMAVEADAVLATFVRGQLLVMFCLAIFYAVGLWLAGLDLAVAVGVTAGLVSFVPYLGVIVGVGLGVAAALLQSTDPWLLIWVLVVFGAGQLLESLVLTPRIVGDRIGLHPVAVIFSVLAGGQLFGFFGVLLALPVAAVLAVGVRHALADYRASGFYSAGQVEPRE
jgi:predicted PurR-regulated permease PerM